MEAHAPSSRHRAYPAASIPPMPRSLGGPARARSDVTHEVPQARDVCCAVWPRSYPFGEAPSSAVAGNRSGALEGLATLSRTLSTRARSPSDPKSPKNGDKRIVHALWHCPCKPEIPRTSNNETSNPGELWCRATPGNTGAFAEPPSAPAPAPAMAWRRRPTPTKPCRPGTSGSPWRSSRLRKLGPERDAVDAGSDRTGAPERKAAGPMSSTP
jgi:hypothetical protein